MAVAVKYGGDALTVGTDYTVSGTTTASGSAYEDKTYTVTITGNGTKYLNSTTKQWTIKAPTGSFEDTALSTTASGCALQDAMTVAVTDGAKLAYVAEDTWELSAVLKWPVTLPDYSVKQDDTKVKYIDEAHVIVEAAKGTTAFKTGNKLYKLGSTTYGDHTYIDTMTWTVQVTLAEIKAAADKGDTEIAFTLNAGAMVWTHSADGLKMTTYRMVLPLAGLQLNDNDNNIVYPTPHKHVWSQGELTNGKIVWTCQTTEPACTMDAPYVTFDAASKIYSGEAVAFTTTKSDNFATLLSSVTVGEVRYFKADGETEIAAPKYTGSYVAKVVVGEKTVSVPFAITKPTDGYTDGWEVNDTATSVRYDKWEEAIEAAADGDTIYYRDGDMNASGAIVNSFEIDFSSDKDITLDLGGAELTNTKSSSAGATDVALVVKNTGAGTVTLANGTIVQPNNSVYSQQVAIQGRFVFGEGIKTVNKGENNSTFGDHRLHIYSDGATLAVTAGQYNNFFESKNDGTITVSGGKFWSAFSPSDFLAENHQIRTIEGNYLYEVFGHAHSFKYVVSGNVITLVCEGDDADDCPYTLQPQKLILTATDAKFTGSAYGGAWYIASNNFVVSGATLGTITFFKGETELAEAPTAVGGYVAKFSVTFGGETFTAAQAFSIGHDHLWEYTAEDDTITMSCTNTCPTALAYAAVLKVADKTYTGAKQTPATVEKGEGFAGEVEISYSADPIAVGSYTAYARIGDATASKTFEIKAANIGGISAELTATEFDYTAADIVNALKSAVLGEHGLTSDDYDISGIMTAKGSGYSNETYKVTLAGKGNFTGSKTLEWTIKAPTREFAEDAFKTTSRLVFNQEKQAWETTSTLAWPCPSGKISTWTQFTALEKALFTAEGETFFGNAAKNGITCDAKGQSLDSKYYIIEGATWVFGCTAAELDAAEGEDVVHTMTACGLVWADKFGLIDYGDAEGIRATDFDVAIPTKDLVLQLPANATYDLGATVLANVKVNLSAGATVTSTAQQTEGRIVTALAGNHVIETKNGNLYSSFYTYTTALDAITVTVPALENADVTVKVGDKAIQPSGENEYTVSYGDTVEITYTANAKGWQPATQTFTLANVTAAQTVSGMETLVYIHDHLLKYEKDGATLTATCTNEETTCAVENRTVALTLAIEDKTFDGAVVSATLVNEDAFTNATFAAVGPVKYLDKDGASIDAPKNAGTYKAQVVVTPGTADGIVLEKEFEIKAKTVSNVTVTLDKASVPETGSEITAQIVSVSDGTTVYTVDDYDVSGDLTGKARGEYDVTLTFKGNYSGKAYASWEIVEGLASFSESGAEITAGGDYGEVEGNVLTITDSTKLVYDAQKEKWFASLTLTWPRTVKYFEDNKWGWMPIGAKYTDVAHAWVKIGETVYTGTQITNGVVEGLTLTTATDKYYPPTKTKDVYDLVHPKSYTFVTSVTWTVEISTNELEKALEEINPPKMPKVALLGAAKATATPTLDKNGFLNYKATFGAYAWGNETEGDVNGLEDTKFTIRLNPEETTLFDEKGLQVWPHHDHVWKYALAGNVLTAACEIAGCAYEKTPLTVSIGPKTVAEKYCDQIPLEAKTDGDELFAEATGATVGSIVYDPALSAQPGTYTASAEVVSADGAVTNTIKTVLSILAGQGITNGVHVADLATYLEAKSQDSMTILVGRDFTASKQYVVPAAWKAETAQEIGLTIQEFVTALFAGEYNDVVTWDDVKDLIAGRTTAQELFQRVQDLGKKVTLLDCGTKTLDLNGFTVTAKEGEPLLRNEGTLVLTGEGSLVTNGCETLIVNLGTLSIESGTYVGSITNDGALVISGGYFTGAIANGQGAVVLTGGTYEIKPEEDFIPAGYDLVKRDGLYTVEKHEHAYTFLPLGNSLMSATCWKLFVDDPDQLIQFSNCGAHKLGVFIATKDAKTGILPKKAYAYTGKPVEANIVGYNYTALAKIGVLKNIRELVEIAEDAMAAEENWDEMNAVEKAQTMIDLVLSINDIDLDLTDLVWSQAKVEEETGLRFGAIRYYDATTDEELPGAPIEAGRYRASIVITTPRGNEITRSWCFTIGLEYEDDFDAWLDAAKDELNAGWKQFKTDIRNAYDRRPTEEEIRDYFDKLDKNHRQYFENLTNEHADVDQKIIDAHQQMVESLKRTHEEAKVWASNAVEAVKRSYEKHEDAYLDEAHEALKRAWKDFVETLENEWGRLPDEQEVEDFFDGIDEDVRLWFDERKQNHEPVDEAIVAAHEKLVAELKAVHASIVKWVDETLGTLEEEAEDESAPLLTMAAAPMAEALEEEELSGWEKFKQDVKDALGRLPTEEEVEAFFEAEGIRHAQFLELLKAKGVTFHDELKVAHEKMVAELKAAHEKIVAQAEAAAQELEALFGKHEDTYFDEAHEALKRAWKEFCEDFDREWNRCPKKDEIEDFFDEVDKRITAWVDAHEAAGQEIDPKIIAAHEKMVAELKEAHAEMVAWLEGRFEQVSDSELKAMPEEESEEAPVLLTLSVADESKAYDGTSAAFELKGKADFERISGCTVEGPYFRPIRPEGPVTDIAPTAPGHYEVFYWIFRNGWKIEFLVKHVFYIEKLLADHVVAYLENGTNFVYNAEEQGPKIWGVCCGLDELVEDDDYEITGTTSATEVGDYAFTVKGRGIYKMYEETFNWSIVAPMRAFEEGAFRIRTELEYNPCTRTWDTVATLDWPYDLRQIVRVPRYYTVDSVTAETTADFADATVEPVLREFYRIKTGKMEQYVKADVWTLSFTPERLTEAAKAGCTMITNTLTAYARGSASEPAGMAKTNFEYVVNLKGLKLHDDEGRQCYPVHNHEWTIENTENGALVADCNCKGCPIGHVELSIEAESKEWDRYPVRATLVDEDRQFEVHTSAEIGQIVCLNESGEPLRCQPTEPGKYTACAKVVIGDGTYKVWKDYEIRTVDIGEATVHTDPDRTSFVFTGSECGLRVDYVIVNGVLLDEGVDYTVGGTVKAKAVGDYSIVIEGVGHYAGTRTVDWSIEHTTRPFADDAFGRMTGTLPYGEAEAGVLTVTASTNLFYDVGTSNWYAGVTVDWPYDLEQIVRAPQYTAPEKAFVRLSTGTEVWSGLDIQSGAAKDSYLAIDVGEFYRIRNARYESYVQRIGWDVEITLEDVRAARSAGEENLVYGMTVASPANANDPDGLKVTTFSVVVPLENLVLLDEKGRQAYPNETKTIEEEWVVVTPKATDYNKHEKTVSIAVADGETVLTENVDYTVGGVRSATAVGTNVVKIIGIGAYTGTIPVRWSIEPSPVSALEEELKDLGDLDIQTDDEGEVTNVVVKLTDDIKDPLVLPEDLGMTTVDLAGFSIIGPDGTEADPDGKSGIVVGAGVRLALVGEGLVKGGNGYFGANPGDGAPAIDPTEALVSKAATVEVVDGIDGERPKLTTESALVKSDDIHVTAAVGVVDPTHAYELHYTLVDDLNETTVGTATVELGSGAMAYRPEDEKLVFDPALDVRSLFGNPMTLVGRLWDRTLGAYVQDGNPHEFDFVFAEIDEDGYIPLTFKHGSYEVLEGDSVVVTLIGGNRYKPARAQLSIVYQTASSSDLDLTGQKFPMTIEWAAGEMGAKTVVVSTRTDRYVEDFECFTLRLAGVEKMSEGNILSSQITIYDTNERKVAGSVTEPKGAAETCAVTVTRNDPLGGFVSTLAKGSYKVGSKVTLTAQARKGYAFEGWQVVESFKGGDVVTNVYTRTTCSFKLAGTDVIAEARFTDTPYVRALASPSDIATASGSGYCAEGKRLTLSYRVNSSYRYDGVYKPVDRNARFLGWFKADDDGQCSDELVTTCKQIVFDRTSRPYAPTATRFVISNDLSCTTFFAKFATPNRIVIANPKVDGKVAGTVSGDGYYPSNKVVTVRATPKTGFVFAGWYNDSTTNAIVAEMWGEESDLFITKDRSFRVTAGRPVTELRAVFVTKAEDAAHVRLSVDGTPVVRSGSATSVGTTNLVAGVAVCWDVLSAGLTATTVTASGLPSGLKLVRDKITKAYTIQGAPTTTKQKDYTAVLKVKTAGGTSVSFKMKISVEPLPTWATGTFNGTNLLAMTVGAAGKISGSVCVDGKRWTLSASSYAAFDGTRFTADVVMKSGKAIETNRISVVAEELGKTVRGVVCNGTEEPIAFQNVWKLEPWKTLATELNGLTGTYAVEDGTVTLKVGRSGAVTAKGVFGTLKPSCSTVIIPSAVPDEEGEPQDGCYIYFSNSTGVIYSGFLPLDLE